MWTCITSEVSALVQPQGSHRSPDAFLQPGKWLPAAHLQPLACRYLSPPCLSTATKQVFSKHYGICLKSIFEEWALRTLSTYSQYSFRIFIWISFIQYCDGCNWEWHNVITSENRGEKIVDKLCDKGLFGLSCSWKKNTIILRQMRQSGIRHMVDEALLVSDDECYTFSFVMVYAYLFPFKLSGP